MKEVFGNLWTYPADVRVITTNGTVKKNGEAVMGRGCALEARRRFPGLAAQLGEALSLHGNHVHVLRRRMNLDNQTVEIPCMTFPVKHNWNDKADPVLIQQSANELVAFIDKQESWKPKTIVLPRPGCGNGGLKWEDVQPILASILDDRFHVITWPYGKKP